MTEFRPFWPDLVVEISPKIKNLQIRTRRGADKYLVSYWFMLSRQSFLETLIKNNNEDDDNNLVAAVYRWVLRPRKINRSVIKWIVSRDY